MSSRAASYDRCHRPSYIAPSIDGQTGPTSRRDWARSHAGKETRRDIRNACSKGEKKLSTTDIPYSRCDRERRTEETRLVGCPRRRVHARARVCVCAFVRVLSVRARVSDMSPIRGSRCMRSMVEHRRAHVAAPTSGGAAKRSAGTAAHY